MSINKYKLYFTAYELIDNRCLTFEIQKRIKYSYAPDKHDNDSQIADQSENKNP